MIDLLDISFRTASYCERAETELDLANSVSYSNDGGSGKAKRGSVPVREAPNIGLQLTAYSVRSSVAPAFGSS